MLILDENIERHQWQRLRERGVKARQIGFDIATKGIDDVEQIIPLLHRLPRPTLFTYDLGFFREHYCHARYCIVCLDIPISEAAFFIRRFLSHRRFSSHANRAGSICQISPSAIREVRLNRPEKIHRWLSVQ